MGFVTLEGGGGGFHKAWLVAMSQNRCPVPCVACFCRSASLVSMESEGDKVHFCTREKRIGPTARHCCRHSVNVNDREARGALHN